MDIGLRPPGECGLRPRFTLQMLRDIVVASTRQGWFSVEDTRFALRAVITASYCETGEYKISG
ncbi:hypothetical protein [Mycobacterium sp.]|uniref:hypothetical protein n=1 Tax=Mycobacterium sp. TaxID=1785 RepID=UPI003C768C4C